MTPPLVIPMDGDGLGSYDTDEADAAPRASDAREELRICVTGGYPITGNGAPFEAEAVVYGQGGLVVARFRRSNNGRRLTNRSPLEGTCSVVRERAEAWIAADDEMRVQMQSAETYQRSWKAQLWQRWLPDG